MRKKHLAYICPTSKILPKAIYTKGKVKIDSQDLIEYSSTSNVDVGTSSMKWNEAGDRSKLYLTVTRIQKLCIEYERIVTNSLKNLKENERL